MVAFGGCVVDAVRMVTAGRIFTYKTAVQMRGLKYEIVSRKRVARLPNMRVCFCLD